MISQEKFYCVVDCDGKIVDISFTRDRARKDKKLCERFGADGLGLDKRPYRIYKYNVGERVR